jgi:hypothetical protein
MYEKAVREKCLEAAFSGIFFNYRAIPRLYTIKIKFGIGGLSHTILI